MPGLSRPILSDLSTIDFRFVMSPNGTPRHSKKTPRRLGRHGFERSDGAVWLIFENPAITSSSDKAG
jgi:hypothetical protein